MYKNKLMKWEYLVMTSFLQLNICILNMDSSAIYICFDAIYIQNNIQCGLEISFSYTYTCRLKINHMSLNCTYHFTLLINHTGKISEYLIDTNNISLKIKRDNIKFL